MPKKRKIIKAAPKDVVRSHEVARHGIENQWDLEALLKALASDVCLGLQTPQVVNSVNQTAGKLVALQKLAKQMTGSWSSEAKTRIKIGYRAIKQR